MIISTGATYPRGGDGYLRLGGEGERRLTGEAPLRGGGDPTRRCGGEAPRRGGDPPLRGGDAALRCGGLMPLPLGGEGKRPRGGEGLPLRPPLGLIGPPAAAGPVRGAEGLRGGERLRARAGGSAGRRGLRVASGRFLAVTINWTLHEHQTLLQRPQGGKLVNRLRKVMHFSYCQVVMGLFLYL
jgi:hypothetical protein